MDWSQLEYIYIFTVFLFYEDVGSSCRPILITQISAATSYKVPEMQSLLNEWKASVDGSISKHYNNPSGQRHKTKTVGLCYISVVWPIF